MSIAQPGFAASRAEKVGSAPHTGRGHQIYWIHFNHSMREPSVVIPVTASVDDDGLVQIEGDDLCLVRWNHLRNGWPRRSDGTGSTEAARGSPSPAGWQHH